MVPHLLWAMYFLFCYPKQEEGCATAAGVKGAINPKTWRKYIWPMIYALSDLESVVVSLLISFLITKSFDTYLLSRLISRAENFAQSMTLT